MAHRPARAVRPPPAGQRDARGRRALGPAEGRYTGGSGHRNWPLWYARTMRLLIGCALLMVAGCGYSCDAQKIYRQSRISSHAVKKVWAETDEEGAPVFHARCASGETVSWAPYAYEGYEDEQEAIAEQLVADCAATE